MQHSKYPLILTLALAALVVPGRAAVSQVPTVPTTTIRIASLAPPGSSFVKVLKAWSRTLQKETEGRVELRVFSGGSEGSDRDLVKRIKAGKLAIGHQHMLAFFEQLKNMIPCLFPPFNACLLHLQLHP